VTWATVGGYSLGLIGWVFVQVTLHEGAHLLAARLVGFSPFAVRIGAGPLLLQGRLGGVDLRVHSLPLFGVVWTRPVLNEMRWKGAAFASAGLLSDTLLLAVMLSLAGSSYFFAFLALYQALIILANLVPHDFNARGTRMENDGKQLLGYLRGRRPAILDTHEKNVARYEPAFRIEHSWLMRCDIEMVRLMIDAQEDSAAGRHAEAVEKYLRVIGQPDIHPAEKVMLLDAIACIPLVHDATALLPAAEGWARQAWALYPRCRTVRGTLGAILVERERYAEGLELLMPLTGEDNPQIDRLFGSCFGAKALHRLGRSAEARSCLQTARSLGASHPLVKRIESELK
jgi:hypothetical protein